MKRNAFFQLIHKDEAMYLKSYPPVGGGAPLRVEDIATYLSAKKYEDITYDVIKQFVDLSTKQPNALIKVAETEMLPENEYAVITIDPKRVYAKLRLYPNSNKGRRFSEEDLIDLLSQHGVKYGLVMENIRAALRARLYCTDILVARATLPVHGSDAQIIYNFDVNKTSKPEMDEKGFVDFHKLDMIEPVAEGQLLATLIPADFGTPGTDVSGNPIKPRKVSVKTLKHGKNIRLSENQLEMYSEISGNVTCVDETVFVADSYEVPADVGPSTGDIDYDGSVNVKGNVISGYTVKASGDICVTGAVEGATLIAGGKIVLNRGVQGMGRAVLEAGGDVISNFIESSKVKAGGKVITDAIMHSNVISGDEVQVNGKRGLIAGGSVRSTEKIETKVAGSSMGTVTELEVGIDPAIVDRYHEIEKSMEALSGEKEKIQQNIDVLTKRFKLTGTLEPEKLKQLKGYKDRTAEIVQQMDDMTEEYDELEESLENYSGKGKVVVYDIAYTSVKITISNISKYLHSEVQHSTFVRDGADIRIKGI